MELTIGGLSLQWSSACSPTCFVLHAGVFSWMPWVYVLRLWHYVAAYSAAMLSIWCSKTWGGVAMHLYCIIGKGFVHLCAWVDDRRPSCRHSHGASSSAALSCGGSSGFGGIHDEISCRTRLGGVDRRVVVLAAIVGGVILVWVLLRVFRDTKVVEKLKGMALNMWEGFSVVARMKGRWQFLILTLCIWGCYFTQLYVAFYAFGFTRALCHEPGLAAGLTPCLVAFVLSSIGMAIPSNGGLGPWNLAVMFGLAIYGISDAEGTAFSMLQWSGQTVMLIILGIYTMVYISLRKKETKSAAPTSRSF